MQPEGHDLGYPNRTQTLRQQKIVNLWITTYALARSQDFDLFESQLLTCHCNRKCERLLRHLSSLTFSVQIVEICVDFAVASFPEDPLVHKGELPHLTRRPFPDCFQMLGGEMCFVLLFVVFM